jgi:hypothetical protein
MSGKAESHRSGGRATPTPRCALTLALILAIGTFAKPAAGQTSPPLDSAPRPPAPSVAAAAAAPSLQPLLDFKDSDIKFQLPSLMNILRDRNHEGWVLAAYPDPSTSKPLIGAGFSLDVEATDHSQPDSLNPYQFIEPSSAQLWQAAGLDADRMQRILDRFNRDLEAWTEKGYRRRVKANALAPELTEEEAWRLLRISAIQAVHNARAYCRDFDRLTDSQQMALSQLVFQMGANLQQFVDFLATINGETIDPDVPEIVFASAGAGNTPEHWSAVQQTLIDSQWARRYTVRAVTVISMFDADYARDPGGAERRVAHVLRPPATHHRKKAAVTLRAANEGTHPGKKAANPQSKRKLT